MFSYSSTSPNTSSRKVSFDFQGNETTASFLNKLSLGQYAQTFIDEGFDSLPALCEITEDDLVALNVKRGHRRVIQRGIATLNGVPQDQPLMLGVDPNMIPTTTTTTTAIATPKQSNGSHSSEGSYTTSGYGSMSSVKHPTSVNNAYESSNSSQYASTSSQNYRPRQQSRLAESSSGDNEKSQPENLIHHQTVNDFTNNRVDGVRSSSFSSNEEDDSGGEGKVLKRKYRRHPKPDKNAPIKPPSAYIMFSNDARAEINKNHDMTFVEIAKIVGDRWKHLPNNQKQRYEKVAMKAKDDYLDALNAYRQTDEYKNYQTYLNNFKSEQDATNRKIARLRKKAKRESPSSDTSLDSSNSTEYGDNPRSSSSSGSTDIYKAHLRNNPPLPSIITTTRENESPPTIEEVEEENNGGECYSPQQKAPPPVSDNVAEPTFRLPYTNDTAASTAS